MITVLTPTYNRMNTLPRLFDSLCAQSNRAFEWLVVDDGSTDGTENLVHEITSDRDFPTRYVRQSNGGKHVAINTGVSLAKGDWILIVDSDDALTDDAIERLYQAISENADSDLSGVCFRKALFDGTLLGVAGVEEGGMFLHPTEAGLFFKGDLAYAFCTSALKRHPFPIVKGEKFVPELYIWNKIGDEGKILYFPNKVIYLCEYLADGYSKNFTTNLKRNPRGFLMFYRSQFFRERSLIGRAKCGLRALQCLLYAVSHQLFA